MSSVVNALEERDAIQRDPDRLERWASVSLVKLNKAKCNVLHLGRGNQQYQQTLSNEWTESSPVVKDFGILVDEIFDMNQQLRPRNYFLHYESSSNLITIKHKDNYGLDEINKSQSQE
ncbi:hypothetical protein DUI87_09320 [Hirundo rustica rustica]|uniref:Uncharacterized protein n=1 Tax=Hirundo rustica rustica TaxID=333673 RepID=A0A3M0KLV7_HIRRU|nr:hypothetical protein DUI87_09320 [Hirundo rustica rustica]